MTNNDALNKLESSQTYEASQPPLTRCICVTDTQAKKDG